MDGQPAQLYFVYELSTSYRVLSVQFFRYGVLKLDLSPAKSAQTVSARAESVAKSCTGGKWKAHVTAHA
jgi:hypothetical protein